MYDPAPATAAEIAAGYVVSDTADPNKDFQFIEIENTGTTTLPWEGCKSPGGSTLPSRSMKATSARTPCSRWRRTATWWRSPTRRLRDPLRRGTASPIRRQLAEPDRRRPVHDHHLSNTSDEIELSSPDGGVIQDFTYQSSWYPQTAGGRFFPHCPQCHAGPVALGFQHRLGGQRGAQRHARHGGNRRRSPCPARSSSTKSWPTRPRPAAT